MGTDLEAATYLGKTLQVQWAWVELGHGPTLLADEVMVMILGQLVARPAPEIQPSDESKLREKVQRPVHRHHPYLGTPRPYPLQTLMLLGHNRRKDSQALRGGLVPATTDLPRRRLEPHQGLAI